MKANLKRKAEEAANRFLDFRNWVSMHWVAYTFVKNSYFIFYFALFVYIIDVYNELTSLSFIVLILVALVFFLLDSKKSSVAQENPKAFLKSEKVEVAVERLFYLLFVLIFALILSIIGLERIGLSHWIEPFLDFMVMPAIVLMIGTAIPVYMKPMEISLQNVFNIMLKLSFLGFLNKRSFLQFVEFAVNSTLRIKARLYVILETMSLQNPNVKKIDRKLPLFKEGIGIYNNHLRAKFDFILCEPDKFYKYARLAVHSKETIDDVRKGLNSLIKLMEQEDEDPFEVVKSLRDMMKEPTTMKSVFNEFDIEPRPFRKWFSVHSGSMKFFLTLVSLIASALFAIMK